MIPGGSHRRPEVMFGGNGIGHIVMLDGNFGPLGGVIPGGVDGEGGGKSGDGGRKRR